MRFIYNSLRSEPGKGYNVTGKHTLKVAKSVNPKRHDIGTELPFLQMPFVF